MATFFQCMAVGLPAPARFAAGQQTGDHVAPSFPATHSGLVSMSAGRQLLPHGFTPSSSMEAAN